MKSGSSFARRPFISTAVAGDDALSRSLTASAKQNSFGVIRLNTSGAKQAAEKLMLCV